MGIWESGGRLSDIARGRRIVRVMTKRRTHPGDTGDSRRLALLLGGGGRHLDAMEARQAAAPAEALSLQKPAADEELALLPREDD